VKGKYTGRVVTCPACEGGIAIPTPTGEPASR
jgi:hypothetical protein